MFDKTLFGMTTTILEKGLNAVSVRQEILANNIANVNTPGFKKKDVTFEMELRRALGRGIKRLEARCTHPKHLQFKSEGDLSRVEARVVVEDDTIFRNDLNNVDIDEEMTEQAKNAIIYEALATRIGDSFKLLKHVIMSRH